MAVKIFILLIFVIFNGNCYEKLTELEEQRLYFDYLTRHKIRISRNSFNPLNLKTFMTSYQAVQDHKHRPVHFETELNAFSHIPYDDFIVHHTGYIPPSKRPPSDEPSSLPPQIRTARTSLPLNFDWRDHKAVTPVRDQGSCGSCWAHAALGVIESRMLMKFKVNASLSVQEVLNCPYSNIYKPNCDTGGWGHVAYLFAMQHDGVTGEDLYPYIATASEFCYPKHFQRTKWSNVTSYFATDYFRPTSEETIKLWLYYYGPLYVTYHVAADFQLYKSGVYTDPEGLCRNRENNHAVLLVGYGTENGVGYWLIKNSWGKNWGENGYFKIKRGVNLCGIARDISFTYY